ncbi:MAG: LamG-like jellyroll fold domain-containing protein, partial [Planctomycetota bacterium]
WRFLAGAHPEGQWTEVAFRDEDWKTGAAGFGYGDGDDRTVLGDMRHKYAVVYIRKPFDVPDVTVVDELGLMVRSDDGFIAYLNGKEVVRAGVGRGSGRSASGIRNHEADGSFDHFEIRDARALLRAGTNVLAIEGHNRNAGSTDFTLDPYLVYTRPGPGVPAGPTEPTGTGPGAASSLTRGLVGWWKFDEGSGRAAKDSSDRGAGGKLAGRVKWAAGRSGKGLDFGGADARVECGKGTGSSPALSVAFWAKADAVKYQVPIDKHTDGDGGRGWNVKFRDNGEIWFRVGSKDSCTDTMLAGAYEVGRWVHVACTFGGGTARAYINGKLRGEKTGITQTTANAGTPLWLGRPSKVVPEEAFDGTLDDVRVWNRVLSANEIKEVAGVAGGTPAGGATAAKPVAPPGVDLKRGLAGHWRLDAGAGTGVRDSSGNGKHGLLKGARWAVGGTTRALALDGKDDYVELPGDTHNFSGAFSVSLLARLVDVSGRRCLIAKDQDSNNLAFVLVAENGTLRCNVKKKAGRRAHQSASEGHPTPLASGTWYHIALVMDAQSRARLYVNGVPSKAKKMDDRNNSGSLRIGKPPDKYWGCIKGFIDDVRIYNRALSAAEVVKLAGPKLAKSAPAGGATSSAGRSAGGAAAGPLGNMAPNGGFEEKDDRGFAKGWTKGQWGARGAAYSVRLDKSNPRKGESALVARGLAEGAKAGASTSLRLPVGTYEIRYWACADVGKSATVGARFGSEDLREQTALDQWKQFTETVTVEKANLNSGLALWVSTPNVRVWFDDVELVRK